MADQPDAITKDPSQPAHIQGDVPGMPSGSESHGVAGEHGVAFEATDIDTRQVFCAGLVLTGVIVASSVICFFLYWFLLVQEQSRKGTDLPPAATEAGEQRLPPPPRLEALEDLRDEHDRRFQLLPQRAEEYLAEQRKKLEEGTSSTLKIDGAIKEAEAKLPVRANAPPAPRSFQRPLPSKASSGWTETGGR
jgi:hypothetical protein